MINLLDRILLSDNVVENFYKNYEDEGFRNWLLSILPEVESCKNLKQDNPWHVYNCLTHILHSVEEINKQTKDMDNSIRRMLAYTMFLHDIGKPNCLIRRYSKLYKKEIDSFFNHNIAGEKIANRVLDKFNFNKTEQKVIEMFIKEHDMFMFITLENDDNPYHKVLNYKYLKEKVKELNIYGNGKKLLKYLILIGRADNKSQNPELTEKSLKLLDKMESMIENMNDNINTF